MVVAEDSLHLTPPWHLYNTLKQTCRVALCSQQWLRPGLCSGFAPAVVSVCARFFFFFFLCFTESLWRKMLWCSPPKSQLHIAQCVWRCASFICWLVDECARSETRLTVKFTRVGEAQKKTLKKTKTKLVAAVDMALFLTLSSLALWMLELRSLRGWLTQLEHIGCTTYFGTVPRYTPLPETIGGKTCTPNSN